MPQKSIIFVETHLDDWCYACHFSTCLFCLFRFWFISVNTICSKLFDAKSCEEFGTILLFRYALEYSKSVAFFSSRCFRTEANLTRIYRKKFHANISRPYVIRYPLLLGIITLQECLPPPTLASIFLYSVLFFILSIPNFPDLS